MAEGRLCPTDTAAYIHYSFRIRTPHSSLSRVGWGGCSSFTSRADATEVKRGCALDRGQTCCAPDGGQTWLCPGWALDIPLGMG